MAGAAALHVRGDRRPDADRVRAVRAGLAARGAPRAAVARAHPRPAHRPRARRGVLRTVVWSVLGLLVFGALFASADALSAEWWSAVLPDLSLGTSVLRAFLTVAVGGAVLAAAYLALNPPQVDPAGAGGRARHAPLRVAGAGAGGQRRLRGVPRRAGRGDLRRPRLPAADDRAHLRRVRPPGLRPAHRRDRADPAGDLGRRPQGPRETPRDRALAARRRWGCCACRPWSSWDLRCIG